MNALRELEIVAINTLRSASLRSQLSVRTLCPGLARMSSAATTPPLTDPCARFVLRTPRPDCHNQQKDNGLARQDKPSGLTTFAPWREHSNPPPPADSPPRSL